ncbi:hypothetical protein [Porphyromonas sp.]|uniref:hypothetical protein n=1 Tax=Porphyromonas sp. TaxID=1924944 RepID=UPI0026DBC010|nr:hypothetical protein [Porphyromonas sp.]MDO4771722.1 hypothetical protein [Porphyromonas sp.]
MKTIYKILLLIAIVGLAWVSVESIMNPIRFKKEKERREALIIAKLMDIRKAQIAYKQLFHRHAGSFEELIGWLNEGQIPTVRKEGELTDYQLENGMTEEKAVAIINKARRTGDWKEAEKEGLSSIVNGQRVSFSRDTTWTVAKEGLFDANYDVANLGIVPGTNDTFAMDTASVETGSGIAIRVFEASVPYSVYLNGLNSNLIKNLESIAETTNRFPGLKVGSLKEINNNAGNWE